MYYPSERYQVCVTDSRETGDWRAIQDQWEELAQTSQHPFAFHQSPAWWDYILPVPTGERAALGIVKASDGSLAGVAPIITYEHSFNYGIRSFLVGKSRLRLARVLGHEPLVPNNECVFASFVRSTLQAFGDCDGIYLGWVSVESECWNLITHSQQLRREALVYVPNRPEPCHFVTLPDSFESYLAKFKAKTRNTLRRKVKRLSEHGAGRLDCMRIEHEDDVPTFLKAGAEIAVQSRVYQNLGWTVVENTSEMVEKYAQLARRGVLRSYLLRCGDEYCAFVRGYQYGCQYYYTHIGFHQKFTRFSPGTVLLFLVIEDLCRYRKPKCLNFYTGGDWEYKEIFGTDSISGAGVILMRRTILNQLRKGSHAALQSSIEITRRLMTRTRGEFGASRILDAVCARRRSSRPAYLQPSSRSS